MRSCISLVHAISPLHAGAGQGIGVVDIPVVREKATGLPYVPGSSLKGVLRDSCEDQILKANIFGSEPQNTLAFASSVSFSDLRLLLLPVRSITGTFAWVTSPYVLLRFSRDLANTSIKQPAQVPVPEDKQGIVPTDAVVLEHKGKIILEELELEAQNSPEAQKWARWFRTNLFANNSDWGRVFESRFCIVSDDVFSFLLDTATEIFSRVRLEANTKTAAQSGLWFEEALPTETILSGLITAAPVRASADQVFSVIENMARKPIQLGGKSTVGRGLCRLLLVGGDS